MIHYFILSLFCALLLCGGYVHSWEPRNVQADIKHVMQALDPVLLCQTFPLLNPLPPNYTPLEELIASFAANVSQLVQTDGTPSLSVNLIYDQDIIWSQGYGLKNLSDPTSVPDGDSKYLIGSNTKLFTTLLALIAQDSGVLSFSDEVAAHVPAFAPQNPFPSRRSINFAQLASHMAGLPRESPCEVAEGECYLSNDEMWQRFSNNVTLVNPPGFIPQYSNAGFAALGHIVEEIMGGEWADLVQSNILNPLGMNNSGTSYNDTKFWNGDRAIGYTLNNAVAEMVQIGWEAPAGSMYSSTNDMAKFISLFFRDDIPYMQQPDQILDSLSLREWRQPRYVNNDGSGYGLPWELFQSPIIYTKGGAIGGYLSLTITVPQLKLGMVVLQSSDALTTYSKAFAVFAANFIQPFAEILQAVTPAPYIPANFNLFVGSYDLMNMSVEISVIKTAQFPLPVAIFAGSTLPLEYFSENVFRIDPLRTPMTCGSQQSGISQYIHFALTSSKIPFFTVPGLFPGASATFLSK